MNPTKSIPAMPLLALLCLLALSAARAATYHVATAGNDANPGTQSQPFLTIGKGISTAANGDIILVASGTYFEVITWNNKSMTLGGAGPGQSIIDSSRSGGGCHTLANVPSTGIIAGFTIRQSGMCITGGAPTVNNCAFTGNNVALSIQASGPTVNDCTFSNNFSTGMQNDAASNPTLNRCTFNANGFFGIRSTGGSVALNNCIFINNSPAGIHNDGAALRLNNCLFYGHASQAFYNAKGNPTFNNCTFNNNGVGLSNNGGGIMNVNNCILWGNATEVTYTGFDRPTVAYSDVRGGFAGTGNMNADPLFVTSAAADYRLQPASPCLNAGSAAVLNLPATDLDGVPRILGGAPDMGAYESTAGSWFVDAALGNDANAGTLAAPFRTVTRALNIAANGNSIYVKAGNYGSDRPRITKPLHLYNWLNTGLARIGAP